MRNIRHIITFYLLLLAPAFSFSAASDTVIKIAPLALPIAACSNAQSLQPEQSNLPIMLKFYDIKFYRELQAHLIIGDALIKDDTDNVQLYEGTIVASIIMPLFSPEHYTIKIVQDLPVDNCFSEKTPIALIKKVLERHPTMNKDVISLCKQFFKEFNSREQIKNGIEWQKRQKFQKLLHGKHFNGKTAFEQFEAELDHVLAYEEEGFPVPSVKWHSALHRSEQISKDIEALTQKKHEICTGPLIRLLISPEEVAQNIKEIDEEIKHKESEREEIIRPRILNNCNCTT